MKRGLVILAALAGLSCTGEIAGLGPPSDPAKESFAPSLGVNLGAMKKTADGLYYQDITIGTGAVVAKDTTVTVTYSGYLKDGTLFNSGASTQLPTEALVPGVREGIIGMAVGGRRRLVVPSALGYGAAGSLPAVPRQSTLIFDINLISMP